MNASNEASRSIWAGAAPQAAQKTVATNDVQVAVIGCGIAGLSAAFEMARAGLRVAAFDRGPIGGGMTSRTTAHLSCISDDGFSDLIETRGLDVAQGWRQSQAAAIDRIEAICRELAVDCDFKRVDGILFQAPGADADILDREYDAALRLGIPAIRQKGAPLAGEDETPAIVYANQARIHPLKYLNALVKGVEASGGLLYPDVTVTEIAENGAGVRIAFEDGSSIAAQYAVVATNSPINDRLAIHAKQAPYRTYAIAFRLARAALADALYWDTLDPYHYMRLQPETAQQDIVIVGGEDHKSGECDDAATRFDALTQWTRRRVPQLGEEITRWSGQVLEPIDGIGFIGRNPGDRRIFVATGDSGQGMTHGALAGMLLRDLIVEDASPWETIYDPSRRPLSATGEMLRENLTVARNFVEYVAPGEISSFDELAPGEGAIVRSGLRKVAAYRDHDGRLLLRSAACTHLGCHVHWNSFEKCWDCPCHGSQFAPDGEALNGPAISPLADFQE